MLLVKTTRGQHIQVTFIVFHNIDKQGHVTAFVEAGRWRFGASGRRGACREVAKALWRVIERVGVEALRCPPPYCFGSSVLEIIFIFHEINIEFMLGLHTNKIKNMYAIVI